MKDKIIKFLDNSVSGEKILSRIAFYLFLICILLVLVFFKLNEINENILMISEPILASIKTEENESVKDVFIEDKFEPGDTLPLLDEQKETSTTETTTKNDASTSQTTENDTKTEVTSSNSDTSFKIDYVINVNSKKIHYTDCTFAERMKEENKKSIQLSNSELNEYLNNGYTLCSTCGG